MDGTVPWPVSLGVAGGAVAALVTLLVWLIRNFVSGKVFITTTQHDSEIAALVKGQELVIAALNATHEIALANQKLRGDEWKETAGKTAAALAVQVEITKSAVESAKINDHFFATYLPKEPDEGHNDGREAKAP